jgi:hypothetical protein
MAFQRRKRSLVACTLSARWGTLAHGVEMPALMMKQERWEPAT